MAVHPHSSIEVSGNLHQPVDFACNLSRNLPNLSIMPLPTAKLLTGEKWEEIGRGQQWQPPPDEFMATRQNPVGSQEISPVGLHP